MYEKDPCHFDRWFICHRRLRNHTGQHRHAKRGRSGARHPGRQEARTQEGEGFPQSDEVRESRTRYPVTIDCGTGLKLKLVPIRTGLALVSLWRIPGDEFIGFL
jgi:hypothetical protein